MASRVPYKVKARINQIAHFLNVKKFILYGGTAVDLLMNRSVNDYDIAIRYKNKKEIINLRNYLENNGFVIIEPWREYIIHKNKKVILVYAKNKEYFLDIAFLKDFNLIGLYDIESVYIICPEMKVIDKYNGLKNLRNKKINLIRNVNSENPYILLGRFVYLCAKYNISLSYTKHKESLLYLKEKCENYKSISNYFNKQVIPSFYSHIFKAILKSEDKSKFIIRLTEAKIFDKIFPSLNIALSNIIKNKSLTNKLSHMDNRQELIHFLYICLDKNTKKEFLKEIAKLKIRKWEVN